MVWQLRADCIINFVISINPISKICQYVRSHLVLGKRKGGGYDLGVKGREPYSSEKESSEKGEGAFGGGDGGGNLEQKSLIGQNESQLN